MCAAISFAVDGDCFNPQLPASPDNSQGNLTAVRDQNSLKHGVLSSKTNKSAGSSSGIQQQRNTATDSRLCKKAVNHSSGRSTSAIGFRFASQFALASGSEPWATPGG
jgi:hypothetical protein